MIAPEGTVVEIFEPISSALSNVISAKCNLRLSRMLPLGKSLFQLCNLSATPYYHLDKPEEKLL